MTTKRKLRKSIKSDISEPMILFIPDDKTDTVTKFLETQPDIITVTDKRIYAKVLDAVTSALNRERKGVMRWRKK